MATKNNKVKSTNDLELKDRLVAINRVTKVTKGGRTFTFAAIVVVGNENGIVGWGLGKANEVQAAIAKGVEAAKRTSSGFLFIAEQSPRTDRQIRRFTRNPQTRKATVPV